MFNKISFAILIPLFTLAGGQSIDQLKEKVDSCLTNNDIPGAAIAIVTGDSVLFAGGFGYADIKNRIPITENTHFMLGSITKSFLALGIIKLVEDGRIDLETPIKEILPEVNVENPWADTDPVRLVHLLEHTAGICDGLSILFNWHHEPDILLNDVIQLLHKRVVITHRPGSFYLYSNIGYLLTGIVLERTAQTKYEDYLRQEILAPLGMETSTFKIKDAYSLSMLAQGYGAGGKEIPYLYVYLRSAAHTHSSALEMAQYVRFFLNYGKGTETQIITSESMIRVETPETSLASKRGLPNGYGLGSEWSYRGDFPWRGHNGAIFGYYSDFWYNRDLGMGYVVLVNQFDPQSAGNVRELRELIAEHLTAGATPVFQAGSEVPDETLEEYTGTYFIGYGAKDPLGLINSITGITKVERTDSTFSLAYLSGSKEDLIAVSDGLFRKDDVTDATVAFFKTSEGTQAMVRDRDYLEKGAAWKSGLLRSYLIWSGLIMLSTLIYACFWLPANVYNKMIKKQRTTRPVAVRIIPLLAVLVLFAGIILIAKQEIYYLGKRSIPNILFFFSTWSFAVLSVAYLVSAIRVLKGPAGKFLRVYSMAGAATYVSLSLFLWHWGIVGMKLWL